MGVTPNGQVSFVSDLWGGRVSDKQITRESGVLDLIESGDNIMVDRGFDIKDIVPEGVTVNMPPFLAGRDQLTAAETRNNDHCLCTDPCGKSNWSDKDLPHLISM